VDYIGIFRDLQKALAIYGSGVGGEAGTGEFPVEIKAALVNELRDAIATAKEFLTDHKVDLGDIQFAEGFLRVRLLDEAVKAILPLEDAADALLVNDDTKQQYLSLANKVELLFQAILPDVSANEFGMDRKAIAVIADKIRSLSKPADISAVIGDVEDLLDQSIAPKGYQIRETRIVDLSQIDFEKLKKQFETARKHIEIEKLRGQINVKLAQMLQLNKYRMNFYEQFQKLIAEYNSGATDADALFAQLVTFAQNLNDEEKRGVAEGLSEEELALFDILTRPNIKLSRDQKKKVQEVAKELLDTLKVEKLVLDWRKKQQTRAAVQLTIEQILDRLPEAYSPDLYHQKCNLVYQHVYDNYYGSGKSVYRLAP
jgi:type I restriction enzyme, R subunit